MQAITPEPPSGSTTSFCWQQYGRCCKYVHGWGKHTTPDLADRLDMLLRQELADEAPAARPLRRRAAMLVGAWAPKLALADRPAAYRALLGLMVRPAAQFRFMCVCV